MKYIRTKDGIFEVYKETENGYNTNTKPFLETTKTRCYLNPFISKEKVIKQADTIEELCDVMVCNHQLFLPLISYDKGNRFNWLEIMDYAKNVICSSDYKGKLEDLYFSVYGAIWTDKGLIHVAKMNEKEELELL